LYVEWAWNRQLSTVEKQARKTLHNTAARRKSLTDKGVFGVIVGFPEPRAPSLRCATPGGPSGGESSGGQAMTTGAGAPSNYISDRVGQIMKRTYQASKVRRARTHGFLVRMKSRGGRAVINARRAKGRKRLAV
jgi:large subunit ribosomal protein L34